MSKQLKAVVVTLLLRLRGHRANNSGKIAGNITAIKKTPEGSFYMSGQKAADAYMSAIADLNDNENVRVANADGTPMTLDTDLRSDLRGYMQPKGSPYERRTHILSSAMAISIDGPSKTWFDLATRKKMHSGGADQAILSREVSLEDVVSCSFALDMDKIGIVPTYEYKNGTHVSTKNINFVTSEERLRRIKLVIEAAKSMSELAGGNDGMVNLHPIAVAIAFMPTRSRRLAGYWEMNDALQMMTKEELEADGAVVFVGDDRFVTLDENGKYIDSRTKKAPVSVHSAVKRALAYCDGEGRDRIPLHTEDDGNIKTSQEFFREFIPGKLDNEGDAGKDAKEGEKGEEKQQEDQ